MSGDLGGELAWAAPQDDLGLGHGINKVPSQGYFFPI